VWSTLIHLFPSADVPVITMSLDYRASARELVELGDSLAILRESGILIIGSGNIVHNLGAIDWSGEHIHPWATEFDARIAD
jgi:4,5-DOPA dioxygenase extradiol